jgi:hypothetical protein
VLLVANFNHKSAKTQPCLTKSSCLLGQTSEWSVAFLQTEQLDGVILQRLMLALISQFDAGLRFGTPAQVVHPRILAEMLRVEKSSHEIVSRLPGWPHQSVGGQMDQDARQRSNTLTRQESETSEFPQVFAFELLSSKSIAAAL